MTEVIVGKIRVQILTESIFRIEAKQNRKFLDANTFFIPNREKFSGEIEISTKEDEKEVQIFVNRYTIVVPKNRSTLRGVKVFKDGFDIYHYSKIVNTGELPPIDKTPVVFPIMDSPRIIMPKEGYTAKASSEIIDLGEAEDIYILCANEDPKRLRKLYVELTGAPELVRLSTLGSWNSKYFAYDQETAKQLILDYEAHGCPLDCMVIDTDWRKTSDTGIGYDVDEKLFPDMRGFFKFAHEHNVEIMFNDHPEPVEGAKNMFDPKEIAFREEKLQGLLEMGLDTWWYDRNWSTKLITPNKDIHNETFGLYMFNSVTANYNKKLVRNKEVYRRPDVMGNVDNIHNGEYLGINNTAAHRYPFQWTGDINSYKNDIKQEVDNQIKGQNNVISYINFDCGGHCGNPGPELFVRWMQFGVFTPIIRPHCTKSANPYREPWVYGERIENITREYLNLRYRLLPIIYSRAFNNYQTGEPIFKEVGYEYKDKKAYAAKTEYLLGNDILIAPVCYANASPDKIVPESMFTKPIVAKYYLGRELKGDVIATTTYKKFDMFFDRVSPLEGVPVEEYSATFDTELTCDKTICLYASCDDGARVYIDDELLYDDWRDKGMVTKFVGKIKPGAHKVHIEYYQGKNEAGLKFLYYVPTDDFEISRIYIPKGQWLDVNSGKVINGPKTIVKEIDKIPLEETPIYVRLGALLPLANNAANTKVQKWNKLMLDVYPSRDQRSSGFLYEDDTMTTAYKLGQYRTSEYKTHFDRGANAFVIDLFAAKGQFKGPKAFKRRDITVKYHLLKDMKDVKSVTVNGEEVKFRRARRNKELYPFAFAKASKSSRTLTFRFPAEVDKDYQIVISL